MMVTMSVIAFCVILVIYFLLRSQSLQKELSQYKHQVKTLDNQSKFAVNTLMSLASEIQKSNIKQLESAHKRGLVSKEDYEVASVIFNNFEYIVVQCCEHKSTVEEAINKAIAPADIDIDAVNQFIAKQPQEVKLPWCKNQVGSFVTACNNLLALYLNPKLASKPQDSPAAAS